MRFYFALFLLFSCFRLFAIDDVIDAASDPAGSPRNLAVNPIVIGLDTASSTRTTRVIGHNLTRLSNDSERLSARTRARRLVLQDTVLDLDGTYTFSHGALEVIGDCSIVGSNDPKFVFNDMFLLIHSGSSLKIGPGVEFIFSPQSQIVDPTSGNRQGIVFQDSSASLILSDATFTVSNNIGAHFINGNLIIEGNSCIDNALSDTHKALFLSGSVTDTAAVPDANIAGAKLVIKPEAKLTLKNAGVTLFNNSKFAFNGSNGFGTLNIEDSQGSFLSQQIIGNSFALTGPKFSSKVQRGDISGSLILRNSFERGVDINDMAWSPDGEHLAVVSNLLVGDEILIIKCTGGSFSILTSFDSTTNVRSIDWSRDGRFLVVGRNDGGGGDNEILVLSFNGSSLSLVTTTPVPGGENVLTVGWSPDGQTIAVGISQDAQETELNVYRIAGTPFTLLNFASFDTGFDVRSVRWSPDGQYLAVGLANTQGVSSNSSDLRLYRFNVAGSTASERLVLIEGSDIITQADSVVRSVDWSPDGQYLAVGLASTAGILAADQLRVFKVLDGSSFLTTVTSLNFGRDVQQARWSPDGRYLAVGFVKEVVPDLKIFKFDGHFLFDTVGVSHVEDVQTVAWSPDGRFIAAGTEAGAEAEIFVYEVSYETKKFDFELDNLTLKLTDDTKLEDVKIRFT